MLKDPQQVDVPSLNYLTEQDKINLYVIPSQNSRERTVCRS